MVGPSARSLPSDPRVPRPRDDPVEHEDGFITSASRAAVDSAAARAAVCGARFERSGGVDCVDCWARALA